MYTEYCIQYTIVAGDLKGAPMTDQLFKKIEQRSIESEILVRMRDAIVSGKLQLGENLNETVIAKQMEVSRIPVREALRMLEQEGLVVRVPNKGCFVATFTKQDVLEVFSMRAALESMAFEWAIPSMTPKDIDNLKDLVAQQDRAVKRKDYDELARVDMRFHEYICIKADHSRLLKAWYEYHAQCQMLLNIRFRHLSAYTPESVIQDHSRILKAIESKDPKAAIELTAQISERVSEDCIHTIEAMQAEGALSP